MTRFAADALLDVDAVVEIDEVGKIVDASPVQRFVIAEAGPHRLEKRGVGEQNRMAVHARLRRWNSRERRRLDRRVTVPAVDAVVGHVVHVAELQWLLDEDFLPRHIARPGKDDRQYNQAADEGEKSENADFREGVRASTEDLRHRRCSARPPHAVELLTLRTSCRWPTQGCTTVVKKGSRKDNHFDERRAEVPAARLSGR